ncbi:MAG: hypothetical protein JWO65_2067 [Sphingomonas bacterium]|nr:hypothetical protein [Sphingomonas bacterium]
MTENNAGENSDGNPPGLHTEPPTATQNARSATRAITVVFAIIGGFASFITLYQFFNRSEASLLEQVKFSQSFVPEASRVQLDAEEMAIWQTRSKDLVGHYCNASVAEIDGSHHKNFYYAADDCDKSKDIIKKIDQSVNYGGEDIQRIDIDLTNRGSNVATNIRFRAPVEGNIVIQGASGRPIKDSHIVEGDSLSLPDMNPADKLHILYDVPKSPLSELYPDRQIPEISHAKGKASVSIYRIVFPLYADIADVFGDLPTVLVFIIIIAVSLMVSGFAIIVFSIFAALLSGKPIYSVVKSSSANS